MTTKQKPTPPHEKGTPTAQPSAVENKTKEQRFWEYILGLQKEVAQQDFGAKVGKGGSELKDSHALHHFVREHNQRHGVTFDLTPINVDMKEVNTGFAVYGEYLAKFFFNGELVYETTTFGAFDTGNSAQATHGSYTAARTSLLFNITQASVKSQQDIEEKRQQELNRQPQRTPAQPGGNYY